MRSHQNGGKNGGPILAVPGRRFMKFRDNLGDLQSFQYCFQIVYSIFQYKYTVSQKNCAKLFLPELHHISTNFDNFWQKDGKEAKIMRDALIFHLT